MDTDERIASDSIKIAFGFERFFPQFIKFLSPNRSIDRSLIRLYLDYIVEVGENFGKLAHEEKVAYRFGEGRPEPFCRECRPRMPCPDGLEMQTILRWDTFYNMKGRKKNQSRSYGQSQQLHKVRRMRKEVSLPTTRNRNAKRSGEKTVIEYSGPYMEGRLRHIW